MSTNLRRGLYGRGNGLFALIGLIGVAFLSVGSWFGWRDYCDRQGVTVELVGLSDLQLHADQAYVGSFTLRNHTFQTANLVSGEPG